MVSRTVSRRREILPLGQVVATPGALAACAAAGQDPLLLLARHASGDWGTLCAEDRRENELALRQGFRVFSVYRLSDDETVWLITEADRASTCLLLPEEY